jgi:hypothetical protein
MTDDQWQKQRARAIWTAFETGRPVFADSDGELRYVDGDREAVTASPGAVPPAIPQVCEVPVKRLWWHRVWRWITRSS